MPLLGSWSGFLVCAIMLAWCARLGLTWAPKLEECRLFIAILAQLLLLVTIGDCLTVAPQLPQYL